MKITLKSGNKVECNKLEVVVDYGGVLTALALNVVEDEDGNEISCTTAAWFPYHKIVDIAVL